MSKPITRMFDFDSGHGAWVPTPCVGPVDITGVGSNFPIGPFCATGNVMAGKIPVHRKHDIRMMHFTIVGVPEFASNPLAFEGGVLPWLKGGSESVLVNNKGCGRVGDAVVCGAVIMTGLGTVVVGD